MSRLTRLCGVGTATLALAAVGLSPSYAASASRAHQNANNQGQQQFSAGSVFVQTDNPAGNSVVVYDRQRDGSLRPAGSYATGGRGGHLDGAVVDNTASQGSVALDRRAGLLYVVNAGSDTVTVFGVQGDHLRRMAVVGTRGDFPVSVSAQGDAVYVLNARAGGSVQGWRWNGGHLTATSHRALGLDPTATPEFTHTPGQVAITPDGRQLVVTTKAGANTVVVYGLDRWGAIHGNPTVNSQPGKVPFAVAFDPAGRLVVANAGDNSVSSFRLSAQGGLVALDDAATGQAATCWVVADGHRVYASNAGSANLSTFRVGGGGRLTAAGITGTDAGTVDAAVSSDGRSLYVQTGAAGVLDVFAIGHGGALTRVSSVTVPNAVGAEGIAAS